MERKKESPGSVFKKNLLFAFTLFSVLPALFVFFAAGKFITRSIDLWFQLRIDRGFVQALELHEFHTKKLRKRINLLGQQLVHTVYDQKTILKNLAPSCTTFSITHKDILTDVYVWDKTGSISYGIWRDEEQWWRTYRRHNDRTIKSLRTLFFQQANKSITQKGTCFDFYGSLYWVCQKDSLFFVIVHRYPPAIRNQLIDMQSALLDYNELSHMRGSIFVNYFFSFLLIVLLILFLAIWCAFYMANGISRPIQSILRGMEQIKQGDLQVNLPVDKTNDLQSLFTGFNEMSKAMVHAQKQLEQRNKEMIHMQSLKTWQEAAKQMAHEIKNPLTPIQLATQRLQRKFKDVLHQDPIFFDCTNTILNQVKVIKDLVSHFSEFASLPTVCVDRVDVGELIKEVLLLYQISYDDIVISFHCKQEQIWAKTDKKKIQHVLINLLDNSIRAMTQEVESINNTAAKQEKVIDITLASKKDVFEITFSDNGPGISASVRNTLFLPYVSTEKKNMGLGLAIVHDTITQLGGTIVLQDAKTGARFQITLPLGEV